jgi:hypothetical protein
LGRSYHTSKPTSAVPFALMWLVTAAELNLKYTWSPPEGVTTIPPAACWTVRLMLVMSRASPAFSLMFTSKCTRWS